MQIHVTIIDYTNCHARVVDTFTYDCNNLDDTSEHRILEALTSGYSVSAIKSEVRSTLAYYPSGFVKGDAKEMSSPVWANRARVPNVVSIDGDYGTDPEPFNHAKNCQAHYGGKCDCM